MSAPIQWVAIGKTVPVNRLPLGWFEDSQGRLCYNGSRGVMIVEGVERGEFSEDAMGTPVVVSL